MSKHERVEEFREFVQRTAPAMSRREFLRHGLAFGLSLPTIASVLTACGVEPPRGAIASPVPAEPTRVLASTAAATTPPTVVPPTATPAPTSPPTPTPVPVTRFAAIGDYGMAGLPEEAVANLVKSWSPDFVLALGDNNYPRGGADTIDANIGQYYHQFIAPYKGSYGPGADINRFWPVLGNHDWGSGYPQAYMDYFTLPHNGHYYTFDWGPARFFMIASHLDEPDGYRVDSVQGQWFAQVMPASTATWNIAVMHHPPFSSGHHGPSEWMQWPFREWGADLVLTGHDHSYERIHAPDGLTYIVNGLGGGVRYAPGDEPAAGSQTFYNQKHGALLLEMDATRIDMQFFAFDGELIDAYELRRDA
jgi:tartrate-resistant acid phosphatase type 5